MQKLSDLAHKLTDKKSGGSESKSEASGSTGDKTGDKDYLDRGIESAEQRVAGDKFDADKMRSTNDKVAGTIKDKFKSSTGHDLPGTSATK